MIEYKGEWFSPFKPDLKFSGTMFFEEDKKISLELSSSWDHIFEIFNSHKGVNEVSRLLTADILLGNTFDGEITLLYCNGFINRSTQETVSIKFYADYFFMGIHFYNLSQVAFKKIKIKYKYLDEWVNIPGFLVFGSMEDIQKGEILVRYRKPNPILIWQKDDLKVFLHFEVVGPTFSSSSNEMNIKQEAYFLIESNNFVDFNQIIDLTSNIQNFLNFVMIAPTCILNMQGESYLTKYSVDGRFVYNKIDIFYKSTAFPVRDNKLHPNDMLFTFLNSGHEAKIYISKWLENENKIKPIIDLYFRAIYLYECHLEQQIINLALAIEAYCNRIFNKKQTVKLGSRNILEELPDNLSNIFFNNEKNMAIFINNVIRIRNHFVHLNDNYEEVFKKIDDIVSMKAKLVILIIILLLKSMGFKYDRIYEILHGKRIISKEIGSS